MMIFDEEFNYTVESNDDDTEVALVVRSIHGEKISIETFVAFMEHYLREVVKAEGERSRSQASNH